MNLRLVDSRRAFTAFVAVILCAAAVALVVVAVAVPGRRAASGENELGNPPGVVDRLEFFDTRDAFERGEGLRVAVSSSKAAGVGFVTLADGRDDAFPRQGWWTSPEVVTPFAYTELLPSWNVSAPRETGLRLEVRVRSARGKRWSPWLDVGGWGRTPDAKRSKRVTTCRQGVVNVDYVALDVPADAYQARVSFFNFGLDRAANPSLRRLAVCYSGVVKDGAQRAALLQRADVAPPPGASWARTLPIPFRTQKDAPKALSGEICSPTSVSMVMAYWGVDRPAVETALAVYDPEHEMFGNWGRAVAYAGEQGLGAWLTRFRDWDAVKARIAEGTPVVASIRFERGEFPSAVLPRTDGHLIVIRGFTPDGDVVVNDPASRERGDGAVYRAGELARAWFDHGGVGYVIRGTTAGAGDGGIASRAP